MGEDIKRVEGNLLLETPCINLEILEIFFARARVPGISSDFSQTPLGFLICEKALSLCLQLQPGSEDAALYEAARFGHVDIVPYFLRELESNVRSQNKGLTYFHTAVLYGHIEMVEFLLSEGAEAHIRTDERRLTCYHLLMMRPGDEENLRRILELLSSCKPAIEVDAKETTSSLTALHMAVRNRNLYGVK
ncbi:putative nacht and ankyrin domain protein [Botrytis fragariae]|uniref:Putative nacht and ankyrin domain protein n=1 Tax=Botrytis fragariae TaxID=1964551 RepID=A0A8H6B4U1_9HELO|nr:putative nacht and ankyrin domain protein [Botrytis fragariae]KAF5879429.1 putative nacht and ankyrin domain protein [Botrytis fragariae]